MDRDLETLWSEITFRTTGKCENIGIFALVSIGVSKAIKDSEIDLSLNAINDMGV